VSGALHPVDWCSAWGAVVLLLCYCWSDSGQADGAAKKEHWRASWLPQHLLCCYCSLCLLIPLTQDAVVAWLTTRLA
jgi:hypothetical protein